ncbi:hypothetical protein [Hymenobacter metallilatus]|uniref:DUF1735 domain-containing protein n=1 Tax=Hymenobacter metallilatus TaxID=2493666 RepID=A0A3R9M9D7_9BACT|nr:hypothetical protein [Hymenobacter metallilatus]RSK36075.1 hypothetical protein EI290_04060 [Hymenobacter metallilatus]
MLAQVKYCAAWLGAAGLLLTTSACQDEVEKLNDTVQFKVALRVKGEKLQGLGAGMEYTTTRNTNTNPTTEPTVRYTYPVAVDTTYQLGNYSLYDDLAATISMNKVSCTTTPKPGPGSYLRLDILVNDKVYETKTLGGTAPQPSVCTPFWLILMGPGASGDDWDD